MMYPAPMAVSSQIQTTVEHERLKAPQASAGHRRHWRAARRRNRAVIHTA